MMSGRTRFPFTATQWQELEHQALIFKYMASGMPIPSDLLFPVKTSSLSPLHSSNYFSLRTPHIGWNCSPLGVSGKKMDPEPGRCRRTDGKKWRCSKEAFTDSKYCERHMHRGKNRSRKPVEINSTTTIINQPTMDTNSHPFLFPHGSSSKPSSFGFSHENNSTDLLLNSGSYSQTNPDYSRNNRFVHGLKEDVDEHAFFSEPSGNIRSFSSSTMNDSWQQRSCSVLQNEYSYLQLHNFSEDSSQKKQDQSSFLFDTDFGVKMEREGQKTMHHFFDEWPIKNRENWIDLEDKSSYVSSTQLSISTPKSSIDFPIFNGRNNYEN